MLECVALGSKATFSYNPSLDDIKTYIAKSKGKKATSMEHTHISDEDIKKVTEILMKQEFALPLNHRRTAGDASESGLIKFCESIAPV